MEMVGQAEWARKATVATATHTSAVLFCRSQSALTVLKAARQGQATNAHRRATAELAMAMKGGNVSEAARQCKAKAKACCAHVGSRFVEIVGEAA